MIRPAALVLMMVAVQAVTLAEETESLNSMIGFIKPGMKLAIRSPEGAEYFDLTIIASDEFFEIARDSKTHELPALAAKYPSVERLVNTKKTELSAFMDRTRADLEPGWDFGEAKIGLKRPVGDLGAVEDVGADFIIVSFGKTGRDRRLYSARFIRTIEWHEGEIEVSGTVPRVNKQFYDRQKAK